MEIVELGRFLTERFLMFTIFLFKENYAYTTKTIIILSSAVFQAFERRIKNGFFF